MGAILTDYGVAQIAAKQAVGQPLVITDFVLADVAGLDFTDTPLGTEVIPTGDIVYQAPFTQSGYITDAKVVYSLFMGSSLGDFDFNWVGLIDDVGGLIAVSWLPLQLKRKNDVDQTGNNLSRSFLVEFSGAQVTTAINVEAEAWQFDFDGDFIALQAKADANESGLAAHIANPDAHSDYLLRAALMGQPFMHIGETPPPNAIELGGFELSRVTYSILWDRINDLINNIKIVTDADWSENQLYGCYSSGDGATTFRLPLVNGEFIRAWDNGRGIDLARVLGAWQEDEFKSHKHNTYYYDSGSGDGNNDWALGMDTSRSGEQTRNTGYAGGLETRPRNIAWMICTYYQ